MGVDVKMYEMYIDPQVSLHDITRQLTEQGMRTYFGKPFSRATISIMLRNPIYTMADLDIYEFFKSQGTNIYNDAADFVGTNGCYYYRSKDSTENKHTHLEGQTLVLAPSEGFIPSDLWLRVRKKMMANQTGNLAGKGLTAAVQFLNLGVGVGDQHRGIPGWRGKSSAANVAML